LPAHEEGGQHPVRGRRPNRPVRDVRQTAHDVLLAATFACCTMTAGPAGASPKFDGRRPWRRFLTTFLTTIAPCSGWSATVRRPSVCRLTCADGLRRTTADPRPTAGGKGSRLEPSGPCGGPSCQPPHAVVRPSQDVRSGDSQAAGGRCHFGSQSTSFTRVRGRSLRTPLQADLRKRTTMDLRGPLPAALAGWGRGHP
jgi:hypothetical protein